MMRASSSSSSCNSTSLINRLKTIFKKAYELSILCGIEVCVIYYGPKGELKTWPKEREKVKDMALRYKDATKRKNSLNLHDQFLEEDKDEGKTNLKYHDWYPIFDHYSPQQLSQLIKSLERTLSTLQERIRFVEAQKQRNMNLILHQSLTPSYLNQTQPLKPSKFSLYMYNHKDATLSQLPLSASHSNQLTNYQNHLMQQERYSFGQNMFMGNIKNNNVLERSCVSNTQDYSPLLSGQESAVNNYGLKNPLKQEHNMCMMNEITNSNVLERSCVSNTQDYSPLLSGQESAVNNYGLKNPLKQEHNMCMMNQITNSNVLERPCISNTVPHEFSSGFQKNPYGDAVGNTSFSQEMLSSYDESSLVQRSSLPSLHTIPNSYCFSDNSR